MGVKLGLSHKGKNTYSGCLKTLLKRIFVPQMEVAGGWRKLHNKELHTFHTSPNIIRVIKSRRMIWVDDIAQMGEMRYA
jgi:hypothetical protein